MANSQDKIRRPAQDSQTLPRVDSFVPTVLAWRALNEWDEVKGQVVRSDARVAELLLGLVRDTAAARYDEQQLLDVVAKYALRAFPNATNFVLVSRDEQNDDLVVLRAETHEGRSSETVQLSRTIAERAMSEDCALLYVSGSGGGSATESQVISRMETAICAPLRDGQGPFGVLQLDVRRPKRGRFTKDDMDLLTVFASQASLSLEHLRVLQQQQQAFASTINALLHSLTLRDPETARHSERVREVAVWIGRQLKLDAERLEVLRVSALLHDLGKQGVSDEVLFKPDRLTDLERAEMATHAAHTQNILDRIVYPVPLRDVPKIAAWHHEKMDGTGPFALPGAEIPLESRILSVADVFDALLSPRPYREALSPRRALLIIENGENVDWDPEVIAALRACLHDVLADVYAVGPESGDSEPPAIAA
jgi:HD-GYP domain-containing protein (c-di-GMP phosphodiesterase class II)